MEGQIELEDYLRSLNCEGFDICDYIPEGRANAVTRYELCMKTGFRDRQVRDLIHYARRDGSILNLSDGKGYFHLIWMIRWKEECLQHMSGRKKAEEIP